MLIYKLWKCVRNGIMSKSGVKKSKVTRFAVINALVRNVNKKFTFVMVALKGCL